MRPGFLVGVFVFVAVASAAITWYLCALGPAPDWPWLFAMILGCVVAGTLIALLHSVHLLECIAAIYALARAWRRRRAVR